MHVKRFPLLLLVSLTMALKLCCHSDGAGAILPSFNLEGLDGARFYSADHRGKTLVMVFWSVFCVPCHRQLSALARHSLMNDPSAKIVSVCVDPADRALVIQGSQMFGERIPVLLDYSRTIAKRLGIKTEPTTLIVDGAGSEVGRIVGYDPSTLSRIAQAVTLTNQRSAK